MAIFFVEIQMMIFMMERIFVDQLILMIKRFIANGETRRMNGIKMLIKLIRRYSAIRSSFKLKERLLMQYLQAEMLWH